MSGTLNMKGMYYPVVNRICCSLMRIANFLFYSIFYQHDPCRLPACLITIHAWLHIPDMIRRSGPVWGYWTWVMEWFCGLLSRAVTSRKHPYASLNRWIREIQTLHAVRNMYDLHERLPIHTPTQTSGVLPPSYHDPVCYAEIHPICSTYASS